MEASGGTVTSKNESMEATVNLNLPLPKSKLNQIEKEMLEKELMEKRRVNALRQMNYLIKISEKYSEHFKRNISKYQILTERTTSNTDMGENNSGVGKLVGNKKKDNDLDIKNCLDLFKGKLHQYQLEGVTWLHILYSNGFNGILADEMGLGKTIQVIALICILLQQNTGGPFLIVAPLSVVPNWLSEFKRFAPAIPVISICGSADNRQENCKLLYKLSKVGKCLTHPVVIVSYQTPLLEFKTLQKFCWRYIIVDEGHRIKNHNTQLAQALRKLKSENRLILTGTPLQNNIVELWALLNFLLPDLFKDINTFTDLLFLEDMQDQTKLLAKEQSDHMISSIHKVLAPFMLRRLKKDVLDNMVPKKEVTVFCPMSPVQLQLYDYVINRNLRALQGLNEEEEIILDQPRKKRKCTNKVRSYQELSIDNEEDASMNCVEVLDIKPKDRETISRLTMQSPLMMFRKIVNHPYLVHFPLDPSSSTKQLLIDENLVNSSGKLKVLDTLLPKLQQLGHKVLLFSQFVILLDLIEDYLIMRGYGYERLDGSKKLDERADSIENFNKNPKICVFLLSTRSGSLGLNLTSADTVIFFDHDWNPQADIQAQDRCHRIGQTKPVVIYNLVTKNTIDEAIINRGKMKKLLEKVIISEGKFKTIMSDDRIRTEDVLLELRQALQTSNDDTYVFNNSVQLGKLLDRSDLHKILKNRKKSMLKENINVKEKTPKI